MTSPRSLSAQAGDAVRLVLVSFRAWLTDPKVMLVGALPAVIAAAVIAALIAALLILAPGVDDLVLDVTGLDGALGRTVSAIVTVLVVVGGSVAAVLMFTTIALIIGQPFFEHLSRHLDERDGVEVLDSDESWTRSLSRGTVEGLITFATSLGILAVTALLGLIPVAGTVAAFVASAILGGRMLAIELTAYPMACRGVLARRDRIVELRPVRVTAYLFGTFIFLIFMLPLGAVVAMPVAVVGANTLSRRAVGSRAEGASA
ncbi:EI24 domain-containing protein [Demequina salsinemoris]|uniref:EI24 domain-containing protein n=1 Tax=Demequina salsinemoris TaxID=577470 RepID=UPI0007858B86|nr:EI24 domain-containing protein [Demequina salsinemoris]